MQILERELILPVSPEKLWAFIATPANLNALTPPELDFKILGDPPETMYDGLILCYRIRIPWFGSRSWVTEIKHIRKGRSFVDEQRLGPYRFWYHYHEIQTINPTHCRMVDQVHYQLPFGLAGELVHILGVRRMLDSIFDFRAEKLQRIFPE